jgi:hypothetical protein
MKKAANSVYLLAAQLFACFMLVFCFAYSLTLKLEGICSCKRRLAFTGLHRVILRNIELFIDTAVRTSSPRKISNVSNISVSAKSVKRKKNIELFKEVHTCTSI